MSQKRACLIYVSATEDGVLAAQQRLEAQGYSVCAVEADDADAKAAQSGDGGLPEPLMNCIESSDVCVFLLPSEAASDCLLGASAGAAIGQGKPIVGIVWGQRGDYPEEFGDYARSMVRRDSERIEDALAGAEIWEGPDRTLVPPRTIKHVRCQ